MPLVFIVGASNDERSLVADTRPSASLLQLWIGWIYAAHRVTADILLTLVSMRKINANAAAIALRGLVSVRPTVPDAYLSLHEDMVRIMQTAAAYVRGNAHFVGNAALVLGTADDEDEAYSDDDDDNLF